MEPIVMMMSKSDLDALLTKMFASGSRDLSPTGIGNFIVRELNLHDVDTGG